MALDDPNKDQLQALSSAQTPAVVVVVPALKQQQQQTGKRVAETKTAAANKAARGRRPPRLAIPAPMACAPGVDPFGAVADLDAEVATELEVQGEGFCLASRRGVRHAGGWLWGRSHRSRSLPIGTHISYYHLHIVNLL